MNEWINSNGNLDGGAAAAAEADIRLWQRNAVEAQLRNCFAEVVEIEAIGERRDAVERLYVDAAASGFSLDATNGLYSSALKRMNRPVETDDQILYRTVTDADGTRRFIQMWPSPVFSRLDKI